MRTEIHNDRSLTDGLGHSSNFLLHVTKNIVVTCILSDQLMNDKPFDDPHSILLIKHLSYLLDLLGFLCEKCLKTIAASFVNCLTIFILRIWVMQWRFISFQRKADPSRLKKNIFIVKASEEMLPHPALENKKWLHRKF